MISNEENDEYAINQQLEIIRLLQQKKELLIQENNFKKQRIDSIKQEYDLLELENDFIKMETDLLQQENECLRQLKYFLRLANDLESQIEIIDKKEEEILRFL